MFSLAVFTDEAYSVIDPYYSIISSPIILYETYSRIDDYNIKCGLSRIYNTNNRSDTFAFEKTKMSKKLSGEFDSSNNNIETTTGEDQTQVSSFANSNITLKNTTPVITTTFNSTISNTYDQDKSILINLVGKILDCSNLNANLTINIKNEVIIRIIIELILYISTENKKENDKVKIIQVSSLKKNILENYSKEIRISI